MKHVSQWAFALTGLLMALQASAQVTLYERPGFEGRSFAAQGDVRNLEHAGFNDRASSVVVVGDRSDRWEVCEDRSFRGRCVVLRAGQYPSLGAMGLNNSVSSVRAVDRNAYVEDRRYAPMPPWGQPGQITLFSDEGFGGRSVRVDSVMEDFRRADFNDRASSLVVTSSRWEVCEDVGFRGRCVVLRPGQYASLRAMGLNDRVSSVRELQASVQVDDRRYGPPPVVMPDYRRRDGERLYEARVVSVRAVVEDAGQRCWVEPAQVTPERGNVNVPGAVLGAVIGGILGHQVGGGTGRDVATGIGVVAGAAIGANAGGDAGQPAVTQNVQHCERQPGQAHPAYWDVTYNFRGQDYRVQMTRPPGNTVTVNERGEPRA
jgi:uncharacterized protein YcfJ